MHYQRAQSKFKTSLIRIDPITKGSRIAYIFPHLALYLDTTQTDI